MAAKFIEIRVSDGTTFGAGEITDTQLYFPKTHVSQVVDLLDNKNKIDISLIPSYMFGGQKFFNTISPEAQPTPIATLFQSICEGASEIGLDDLDLFAGRYFQATANMTVSLGPTGNITSGDNTAVYKYLGKEGMITFLCDPDDGVSPTSQVTLEANDYLVFKGLNIESDGGTAFFGIINNTYGDASTSEKGVVQLATDTEVTTGTNTTKAVTPAGAKKAVQKWGEKHPTVSPVIGTLGNLRVITNIELSGDGHHIKTITTGDIPTATFAGKGVVRSATVEQVKEADLNPYVEQYAVSPPAAKAMIDYWGRVDYFSSLTAANESPLVSVEGKMILVGI